LPDPNQPAHIAKSLESEETFLKLTKSLEIDKISKNLRGSKFRGFPPSPFTRGVEPELREGLFRDGPDTAAQARAMVEPEDGTPKAEVMSRI
jgi:hypothetical protein